MRTTFRSETGGFPHCLLATLCIFAASDLYGQSSATKAGLPALEIVATRITESRMELGAGTATVVLSFSGEGLSEMEVVGNVTVTNAVDDRNRVLTMPATPRGGRDVLSINVSRMALGRSGSGGFAPLNANAQMRSPARDATSIKFIEGTVEIFLPTEASGSLVRLPNIMSHAGRLEHPTLAKHGIEYWFLGNQAAYDEAVRHLNGTPGAHAIPVFPNHVGYFKRDPSSLILAVQLQDAGGKPLPSEGSGYSGVGAAGIGNIRFSSPPPKDAQLVLFLSVPEATRKVPFRVENIPLP